MNKTIAVLAFTLSTTAVAESTIVKAKSYFEALQTFAIQCEAEVIVDVSAGYCITFHNAYTKWDNHMNVLIANESILSERDLNLVKRRIESVNRSVRKINLYQEQRL